MAWPAPQDYNEAIQNPALNFKDPVLRQGQPETTPLGLPKAISGGFATVYKLQCGNRTFAVRCFQREIPDQHERYAEISRYLLRTQLPYTVGFEYLEEGIRVGGRWYPILKMEWVPGETLDSYIQRHLPSPQKLAEAAERWAQMVHDLGAAGIAHGDLQHGNVLVINDEFKLIDYDGMYVPALAGRESQESGHRNYQSPERLAKHYGPYLDNFSATIIYFSLIALSIDSTLWHLVQGGDECLLFRGSDYQDPNHSSLISTLLVHPDNRLRIIADQVKNTLQTPPEAMIFPTGSPIPGVPSRKPSQTGTSNSADWIYDHLTSDPDQASSSFPFRGSPQPVSGTSLEWVWDMQATAVPLQPSGRFENPVAMLRIFFYASVVCLPLGVWFFTTWYFAILTWLIAALTSLSVLRLAYRNEKAVANHQKHAQEYAEANRESKRLQEDIAVKEREIVAIRAQGERQKTTLNQQLQALDRRASFAQTAMGNDLRNTLAQINKKKAALDRPIEATRRTFHNTISRLGDEIRKLDGSLQNEINRALVQAQQDHINQFLRSHTLQSAALHGIGPQMKANLRAAGFTTAADITYGVKGVHGIGDSKAATLMAWRRQISQTAENSKPLALSPSALSTIQLKYKDLRDSLEREVSQNQTSLRTAETSHANLIAQQLQAISQELRDAEIAAKVKSDQANRDIEKERRALSSQIQELPQLTVGKVGAVESDIRQSRYRLHGQTWKTNTLHQQLRAEKNLTFCAFVARVAGNSRT